MRIIVCVMGGLLGLHIDYNGLKNCIFCSTFYKLRGKSGKSGCMGKVDLFFYTFKV